MMTRGGGGVATPALAMYVSLFALFLCVCWEKGGWTVGGGRGGGLWVALCPSAWFLVGGSLPRTLIVLWC